MEFAKVGPTFEKYVLNASAISPGEVSMASFTFNSFTDVSLGERPSKLLIVFQASLGLLF